MGKISENRKMVGLKSFQQVNLEKLFGENTVRIATAYMHSKTSVRVILYFDNEKYEKTSIVQLTIPDVSNNELDFQFVIGGQIVKFENLVNVTQTTEQYGKLFIHTEGLFFEDEKGICSGIGFLGEESIFKKRELQLKELEDE